MSDVPTRALGFFVNVGPGATVVLEGGAPRVFSYTGVTDQFCGVVFPAVARSFFPMVCSQLINCPWRCSGGSGAQGPATAR